MATHDDQKMDLLDKKVLDRIHSACVKANDALTELAVLVVAASESIKTGKCSGSIELLTQACGELVNKTITALGKSRALIGVEMEHYDKLASMTAKEAGHFLINMSGHAPATPSSGGTVA